MILMMAVSVLSLNAQPAKHKEGHQRPTGPPPEMKKYLKENLIPVLRIQRQELDKELSKQEIARIDEIRTELKSLREQQRNFRKDFQESATKPTVEQRRQMREYRKQMATLMDEVEIMAENHDAKITALLNEIQPEIEKAHLEMQRMMDVQNPNEEQRKHHQNQNSPMMPPPGHEKSPESPLHRLLTPEGFLLWNPGETEPGDMGFFGENESRQINVFPNPAENQVQISLNLESDTKVEISIFDKNGNNVQTLPVEKAAAGIYSKTIKTNDLPNGLYFVKIKAGATEAIERIFIDK